MPGGPKAAPGRSARSKGVGRRHARRTTSVGAVLVRFILVCADVGAVPASVWSLGLVLQLSCAPAERTRPPAGAIAPAPAARANKRFPWNAS